MASEPRRMADLGAGRATLVDSNVLLDVLTDDPTWAEWSGERDRARDGRPAG